MVLVFPHTYNLYWMNGNDQERCLNKESPSQSSAAEPKTPQVLKSLEHIQILSRQGRSVRPHLELKGSEKSTDRNTGKDRSPLLPKLIAFGFIVRWRSLRVQRLELLGRKRIMRYEKIAFEAFQVYYICAVYCAWEGKSEWIGVLC